MAKTQITENESSGDISFSIVIGTIIGISIGTLLGSLLIGIISWVAVSSLISFGALLHRKQL